MLRGIAPMLDAGHGTVPTDGADLGTVVVRSVFEAERRTQTEAQFQFSLRTSLRTLPTRLSSSAARKMKLS